MPNPHCVRRHDSLGFILRVRDFARISPAAFGYFCPHKSNVKRHSEHSFFCHSEGRKSRRIYEMFRRLAPQHDHKGHRHSEGQESRRISSEMFRSAQHDRTDSSSLLNYFYPYKKQLISLFQKPLSGFPERGFFLSPDIVSLLSYFRIFDTTPAPTV